MKNSSNNADKLRVYLKRLGNPYASLQVVDDVDVLDYSFAQTDERSEQVRRLRNPYATLAADEDLASISQEPVQVKPVSTRQQTLSKATFNARCREIFKQYIPHIEKGRIRKHHREFITRNESKSPTIRHLIVSELSKYDLSDLHGVSTQFNRERDTLTEQKLKYIAQKYIDNGD